VPRTQQKVNEMLGNINTTSSFAAFEKMEEKGEDWLFPGVESWHSPLHF